MFKPLLGAIAILIIMIINIKFLTVKNFKKIEGLDTQNYQIIEEYRNIKQKYPEIKNMANLADLYSLTALLKVPVLTPFDFLEQFIKNLPPDIYLNKISWKLQDPSNNVFTKDYINIAISFKYIKTDISIDEAQANLDSYIKNLKSEFQNFSIQYSISNEPLNILDRVIIPATLTVSGPERL